MEEIVTYEKWLDLCRAFQRYSFEEQPELSKLIYGSLYGICPACLGTKCPECQEMGTFLYYYAIHPRMTVTGLITSLSHIYDV